MATLKTIFNWILETIEFIRQSIITVSALLILFIAAAIYGVASREAALPVMEEGSALVLAPEGRIVEKTRTPDPMSLIMSDYSRQAPETSIHAILTAIKRAKVDSRIKGIVLITDKMQGAGPSKLHAIADALKDFKEDGKSVYSVSSAYSQSDYLIAAQSDKIFMNPHGNILLTGYGRYGMYYKGLLDKIKANVNIFRVGTFKSAVEPFIRTDMSDAAKEANHAYMDALWSSYTDSIASARGMESEQITDNINATPTLLRAAGGNFAELAVNSGLVDELKTRSQWRSELIDIFGLNKQGKSFKQIYFRDYLAATNKPQMAKDHIAVITAQGEIIMGEGDVEVSAAETLVRQILRARSNPRTKAIILRVDSPGGSAFASELIRQELSAAQASGIPVIASFGSVAASGGYWISATADEIIASPTTITGSIGIFGIFPTFEKTLAEIGISTDGVGTTKFAGVINPARPLGKDSKDIMQQSVEAGYRAFLDLVSTGRNLPLDVVAKIAEGRVWAGSTALELGLVDKLGSFDDAVKAAATHAEIEEYSLIYYGEKPDKMTVLLNQIFNSSLAKSAIGNSSIVPPMSPFMKLARDMQADAEFLTRLNDPSGQYLICMECQIQ